MSSSFLPIMAEAGAKAAGAGVAGLMGAVDIAAYKRIFFHAALIMGFCSGLMAGQMGEGKVLAGLKHSLIMLFAAFFMFRVFI
jgi:flagellar protein FlaJ